MDEQAGKRTASKHSFRRRANGIPARLLLPVFVVGAISTLVMGYSLVTAYMQPAEVERFIPEYSYRQNAQLDHAVYLKPNKLFGETSLGPGHTYFAKTIDRVDITFAYSFDGEPAAEVKGIYEVRATTVCGELSNELVETGKSTERTKLWEKQSALLPPTPFVGKNGSVSIRQTIPIQLEEFRNEAGEINEELGVGDRQQYLKIQGLVRTLVSLPSKEIGIKELVTTTLIPLGQAYFVVSGRPQALDQDSIGRTERVVLDDVLTRREQALIPTLILGAVTGVLGIVLVLRLVGRPAPAKGKPASVIPRRYRERIAEADGQAPHLPADTVPLLSLKDLIKVADEAGKPILHQAVPDGNDIREAFYVCDGPVRYAYLVKENKHKTPLPNEAGMS